MSLSRRYRPRRSSRVEAIGEQPRHMCFRCMRPQVVCHCEKIPTIDNQTEILVVQHIKERSHPFNTARMVTQSLTRAELLTEYSTRVSRFSDRLGPRCGLLYPSPHAIDIATLPNPAPIDQLVLLDGTWNQVKRLYRNWPDIQNVPHYKISPPTPGQYRIRLEPNDQALSTVEATVAALQVLEPELTQLNALLECFQVMVQRQLDHPEAQYERSLTRSPTKINTPRLLLGDLSNVIVAYGEAAALPPAAPRRAPRPPAFWVAKHLGTGEQFSTAIKTPVPPSEGLLEHFELAATDFTAAISVDEFRQCWSQFRRPSDVLVVFNASTLRLLTSIELLAAPFLELKAINYDPERTSSTLREFFLREETSVDPPSFPGRAGRRLANLTTLIRFLRKPNLEAGRQSGVNLLAE